MPMEIFTVGFCRGSERLSIISEQYTKEKETFNKAGDEANKQLKLLSLGSRFLNVSFSYGKL